VPLRIVNATTRAAGTPGTVGTNAPDRLRTPDRASAKKGQMIVRRPADLSRCADLRRIQPRDWRQHNPARLTSRRRRPRYENDAIRDYEAVCITGSAQDNGTLDGILSGIDSRTTVILQGQSARSHPAALFDAGSVGSPRPSSRWD